MMKIVEIFEDEVFQQFAYSLQGNFLIIIFQMIETLSNVLSNDEISFKLTENVIPSIANSKGTFFLPESSLEYTNSRISIQEMLLEDLSGHEWLDKLQASNSTKNSSLKVSSINATNESFLKHTPRASFRQRTISSAKFSIKPSRERPSFHIFDFDQEKMTKSALVQTQRKRCCSERRRRSKISSKKQVPFLGNYSYITSQRSSKTRRLNDQDNDLLNLKKTMQITQIKLKADEHRQKNYLKRIIQTRMHSMHPIEESDKSIPLWTSRKPCFKL